MTNPFDDQNCQFHVVVNGDGQHSIWPEFAALPAGWRSVTGPSDQRNCLAYIEANWTDMRPASLRSAS